MSYPNTHANECEELCSRHLPSELLLRSAGIERNEAGRTVDALGDVVRSVVLLEVESRVVLLHSARSLRLLFH